MTYVNIKSALRIYYCTDSYILNNEIFITDIGCLDLWETYATKTFPFKINLNQNFNDIIRTNELSRLQSIMKPGNEYTMVLNISSPCPNDIEIGFSGKGGWFKTDVPANSNNVLLTVTDTWEDERNTRFENRQICSRSRLYSFTIHQIQLFEGSRNCIATENGL